MTIMARRSKLIRLIRQSRLHWLLSASVVIFVSSNFVNIGNLLFNLVFSRWMGPALFSDLAFLLTLMLSILGVLNAIQLLVTEQIAAASRRDRREHIRFYQKINRIAFIGLVSFFPLLVVSSIGFDFAARLGLHDQNALIIFYFGAFFYLPLAIWRGVAQGKVDLWRMVSSANAEMLTRFFGGALLWWMGYGLAGVIFAFVLSLFVAWWFAKPRFPAVEIAASDPHEALPWTKALPWAAIQLAIVLQLDGEVFIAKAVLSAEEAGYIAAISLVQRIEFFACFSLASLLLPQIIMASKKREPIAPYLTPIVALILLSTIPVIAALALVPEFVVTILFGEQFMTISELLIWAGISASLITLNYFLVMFVMAYKWKIIAYLMLGLSLVQLAYLRLSLDLYAAEIEVLVKQKLVFQIFALCVIAAASIYALVSRGVFRTTKP